MTVEEGKEMLRECMINEDWFEKYGIHAIGLPHGRVTIYSENPLAQDIKEEIRSRVEGVDVYFEVEGQATASV
ncbi:MAG TPA: hypothetical protein VHF05_02370 [Candidatus Paceibacterota bacterium]|nr:hypothetical protein [Candidatus Paceibacterota bacterium]